MINTECRKLFPTVIFVLCCFSLSVSAKGTKDNSVPPRTPDSEAAAILAANNGAAYTREKITGNPVSFNETWGFVVQYSMDNLDYDAPLTDLAFFSAVINNYGELDEIPDRSLLSSFSGRVHLVFSSENRSLVHFAIDPRYDVRSKLEDSLVEALTPYDGLVIDMEYIPARDRENFLSFLADMKKKLPGKIITICVPARTKTIPDDMFPYAEIGKLADRVIIMAYDEHWSRSRPGPVASFDWCSRVTDYALSVIPKEKIVMGLPFYGRTWADENHAGAWRYNSLNKRMIDNGVTSVTRDDGGVPDFQYTATINVTGYFDDTYSLVRKCRMYAGKHIENVSFWCIGQEDPSFWQWITGRQ